MNRYLFAPPVLALLALTPLPSQAAPFAAPTPQATNPSVTLVDGWWEHEHHEGDAPDRYWHLQREQRDRYDRLQAEQARREAERRRFDDDDRRGLEEQHRLLGFQIVIPVH